MNESRMERWTANLKWRVWFFDLRVNFVELHTEMNWIQSSSSWDSPLIVQGKLNGMIPIMYKTGIIHTKIFCSRIEIWGKGGLNWLHARKLIPEKTEIVKVIFSSFRRKCLCKEMCVVQKIESKLKLEKRKWVRRLTYWKIPSWIHSTVPSEA